MAGSGWWPGPPGQGQGFELGDQGAEPTVVAEPLPVVVELVVGDEPGDGLAAGLAGPLPVGAVQDGRVGVAAAAGLAAADVHQPDGAPSHDLQAVCGQLPKASIPPEPAQLTKALAADWTDVAFSSPPPPHGSTECAGP